MSLFNRLIGSHVVAPLFSYFGDTHVDIVYKLGTIECHISGIKRVESIESRIDDMGDIRKVRTSQITIARDLAVKFGGVADPGITGVFEITVPGYNTEQWSIDSEPGKGIEVISESLCTIHLIKTGTVAMAGHNAYRRQ